MDTHAREPPRCLARTRWGFEVSVLLILLPSFWFWPFNSATNSEKQENENIVLQLLTIHEVMENMPGLLNVDNFCR